MFVRGGLPANPKDTLKITWQGSRSNKWYSDQDQRDIEGRCSPNSMDPSHKISVSNADLCNLSVMMMVPQTSNPWHHSTGSFPIGRPKTCCPEEGWPNPNLQRRCNAYDFQIPKKRFDDIERSSLGETYFLCATYYRVLLPFRLFLVSCFTYSLFFGEYLAFRFALLSWLVCFIASCCFCSRHQHLLFEAITNNGYL